MNIEYMVTKNDLMSPEILEQMTKTYGVSIADLAIGTSDL